MVGVDEHYPRKAHAIPGIADQVPAEVRRAGSGLNVDGRLGQPAGKFFGQAGQQLVNDGICAIEGGECPPQGLERGQTAAQARSVIRVCGCQPATIHADQPALDCERRALEAEVADAPSGGRHGTGTVLPGGDCEKRVRREMCCQSTAYSP
jgi:hypothetical protein